MKRNCNTTPCSSVHFNCYVPASSRSKQPLLTLKRFVITGWPERTSGRFLSGRLPSSNGHGDRQGPAGPDRNERKRRALIGMKEWKMS